MKMKCPNCGLPNHHYLGMGEYACDLASMGYEPYKSIIDEQKKKSEAALRSDAGSSADASTANGQTLQGREPQGVHAGGDRSVENATRKPHPKKPAIGHVNRHCENCGRTENAVELVLLSQHGYYLCKGTCHS